MQPKDNAGSAWTDPDDAPELTDEMLARAEIFEGRKFIGRGRPRAAARKEPVSLRLDEDILTRLRADGPGWQTRVNALLRVALKLNE